MLIPKQGVCYHTARRPGSYTVTVPYLAKPWLGQFGLLGLGTLTWFLAVVSLLIPIGLYTPPYLHGRRDITFYHATRHKELLQGGCDRNMNG